jgi:hypothetical protein
MNKNRCFTLATILLVALALTFYNSKLPSVQAQTSNLTWHLTITGLVENPLNLTLDDLKAMPSTSEYAQLYCVDDPRTPVSQGNWTGVELSYLLQQANVSSDATKIAFFAPDGFSTDQTVGAAMGGGIILAYQKDNVPLGELQLVVPNEWGYKWIRNPTQIQLVNFNFLGTEESMGYSDDGVSRLFPAHPPTSAYTQQTQPENLTTTPTPSPPPTSSVTALPTPISTPNPTTPTQYPAQSQSPAPIVSPTALPAASTLKPQSTSPVYIATFIVIIAASTVAFTVILTRRKKNKPASVGLL